MTDNSEETPAIEQQSKSNRPKKKVVYFAVGPQANEVTCPFCGVTAVTKIQHKIDSRENLNTYLRILLCWCPLALISCLTYFIPCYRIPQHYCSKCGEYLGTYHRPKL